jgi:hypothetical protein
MIGRIGRIAGICLKILNGFGRILSGRTVLNFGAVVSATKGVHGTLGTRNKRGLFFVPIEGVFREGKRRKITLMGNGFPFYLLFKYSFIPPSRVDYWFLFILNSIVASF